MTVLQGWIHFSQLLIGHFSAPEWFVDTEEIDNFCNGTVSHKKLNTTITLTSKTCIERREWLFYYTCLYNIETFQVQ